MPEDKMLRVLVIGRHEDAMKRTLGSLRGLPVRTDGATTDEQALELLNRSRYDVVSIGGGVEPGSRIKLKKVLAANMPDVQLIEVPRPDDESMHLPTGEPIRMDGPDELALILTNILELRARKQLCQQSGGADCGEADGARATGSPGTPQNPGADAGPMEGEPS